MEKLQFIWQQKRVYRNFQHILAHLKGNPNTPSKHGKTPIHLAAKNGHKEIVNFLFPLTDAR